MSNSEYVVRRFVEGARWFWTCQDGTDVKLTPVEGGIAVTRTSPDRWSADLTKAIRFGNKEDAQKMVEMFKRGENPVVCEVGRVRLLEIE